MNTPAYAELAVMTNFSFLRGASHPEELVAQAVALGLAGLGVSDRNSVAGVVRAHVYLREKKIKNLRVFPGARLVFCDGTPDIIAYPRDRGAWGRLTRLITTGNMRAHKGQCWLTFGDLLAFCEGLQLIVMAGNTFEGDLPKEALSSPLFSLTRLKQAAPERVWVAATMLYGATMRGDLADRVALARQHGLPLLAVNDVIIHGFTRRALADIVTCIREGVTIDEAGLRLHVHAERHLKDPAEMARLFEEAPDAVPETMRFIDALTFCLDELGHDYPHELREGYASAQEALEAFSWQGAAERYPQGIPKKVIDNLRAEFKLIAALDYAAYFLTVHDIVRYARGKVDHKGNPRPPILCQGRGSAANSSVCYCLFITDVDPTVHELLFARFISSSRNEPPDIDVDFEHERREDIIQYIYKKYGLDHAALTATVVSYRTRSTTRDCAKVFGFSEEQIKAMSGTIAGWWSGEVNRDDLRKIGFDPDDHRLKLALDHAGELATFPRHLSQHTGGFVINRTRLDEVVPIMKAAMDDRSIIEWDKDDLDALKILKVDVLALGMLSALNRGFDLLKAHYGLDPNFRISHIAADQPPVYAMIQRADTIGVFQIESRAQMSMLPRLRPEKFYDLVIEVAIVRPGPIQGDMVHPYLRRKMGYEPVSYPSPDLEKVLSKTLGVPLFQEQAMRIAIVGAGFTPDEADELRRAMATFKRVGTISALRTKMVEGMVKNSYDREFAERCFKQIEGFGTYGFPESHAASFALLVYASSWMKCRYPDVFVCALLNSQPMGFYAPSQLVRDAREHGVEMRAVDINHSYWDSTLEPFDESGRSAQPMLARNHEQREAMGTTYAVRLGFRQVSGLREADMTCLVKQRGRGYDSVRDLWLRTGLTPAVLERLAAADAFCSICLDRRDALWAVRGLNRVGDKDDLPLFARVGTRESEPDMHLPAMPPGEHVVEDYRHLALSLKGHPVLFLRAELDTRGIEKAERLGIIAPPATRREEHRPSAFEKPSVAPPRQKWADMPRVTVAGLVLVRQRPGSSKGVIFMTIEDETGVANIIVWPKIYERERPIVLGARFVAVTGRLQNEAGVIHVVAEYFIDLTPLLAHLSQDGPRLSSLANADEIGRPQDRPKQFDKAQRAALAHAAGVMPKGRNFH